MANKAKWMVDYCMAYPRLLIGSDRWKELPRCNCANCSQFNEEYNLPRFSGRIDNKDKFEKDGSRFLGIEAGEKTPYYCIHLTKEMVAEITGRIPEIYHIDGKWMFELKLDGEVSEDRAVYITFR